jgi:hypothetical protein
LGASVRTGGEGRGSLLQLVPHGAAQRRRLRGAHEARAGHARQDHPRDVQHHGGGERVHAAQLPQRVAALALFVRRLQTRGCGGGYASV